jgi:hypothetical protein
MIDRKSHSDNKKWKSLTKDVAKKAELNVKESTKKLAALAKHIDAESLLVAVYANITIGPVDQVNDFTHGTVPAKMELLAYNLYPLFGVSKNKLITPCHTNDCIDALEKLFTSRQQVRIFSDIQKDKSDSANWLVESLRMDAEIVRGSAYPDQTAEEIVAIQGKFEKWFSSRLGIGPKRAQELLMGIALTMEDNLNTYMDDVVEQGKKLETFWKKTKKKKPKDRTDKEKEILSICKDSKTARIFGFVQRLNEVALVSLPVDRNNLRFIASTALEKEWDAIISLIGMTREKRELMTEPIEVQQKPMFVLSNNRVIIVGVSNALDVLWERFEVVAKSDQSFYDNRYQKKKAKWLEEKASECLSRIFPQNNIYRRLSYPDPDKDDGSTAELDIAVHWGPFIILAEAKAKQFRMESQLGDLGRLRTDIKANVEDAFEQARRAVRYIDKEDNPEFIEISSGRKLSLKKRKISRIYLITVSQHQLAGRATRLAEFRELGLFKDKEYPFSICAADLDTVSQFCEGPDVFLHYIERRLKVQHEHIHMVADELELLGAYLDSRLQAERLWKRDQKSFHGLWLAGFQEQFDLWMRYKRGQKSEPPDIGLKIPDEIKEILVELRNHTDNDDARWIAFSLLSLSDYSLAALASMIRDVRQAKITSGMLRRCTHQEGDTIISIVASMDVPSSSLQERTYFRAVLEKYRRKAFKSVGIGIMVSDTTKPLDCAAWVEGPWQYDEKLEKVVSSDPPFVPAPGQKMPGRNELCICGSGKKFKQCCLPKIEASQKNISNI